MNETSLMAAGHFMVTPLGMENYEYSHYTYPMIVLYTSRSSQTYPR